MAAKGTSPVATSPPSGSNSQSSSTHPLSQPPVPAPSSSLLSQPSYHQEEIAANNDVKSDIGVKLESTVSPKAEEVGIVKATEPESSILDVESEESMEKYKKYEADYAQRLMAKYFSNKDIYGDDIFEVNYCVDDASIRASRWPCMRSYADPLRNLESYTQLKEMNSSPDAGTPEIAGGGHEMANMCI